MKTCRKCLKEWPLTAYHKAPQNADGFCNTCKGCRRVESKLKRDEEKKKPANPLYKKIRFNQWFGGRKNGTRV